MKYNVLITSIFLTHSVYSFAGDIRVAIDPWGNRVEANEIASQKQQVQAEIEHKIQELNQLNISFQMQNQNNQSEKQKLDEAKSIIKSQVTSQIDGMKNIINIQADLVEKTSRLLENTEKILRILTNTQNNLDSILETGNTLIKISPFFENTEENRLVWKQVILNLLKESELEEAEKEALNQLKKNIEQANRFFWKPSFILNDFQSNLTQYLDSLPPNILAGLIKETKKLMDLFVLQIESQKKILDQLKITEKTLESIEARFN